MFWGSSWTWTLKEHYATHCTQQSQLFHCLWHKDFPPVGTAWTTYQIYDWRSRLWGQPHQNHTGGVSKGKKEVLPSEEQEKVCWRNLSDGTLEQVGRAWLVLWNHDASDRNRLNGLVSLWASFSSADEERNQSTGRECLKAPVPNSHWGTFCYLTCIWGNERHPESRTDQTGRGSVPGDRDGSSEHISQGCLHLSLPLFP